jgi:hypothetical protein
MNLVFTFMVFSFFMYMVMFLSIDGNYYLKYAFSASFSNHYPALIDSKSYTSNRTLSNNDCDFLNLCDHIGSKLSGILLPTNNNIIDISYLKSYLELPFP